MTFCTPLLAAVAFLNLLAPAVARDRGPRLPVFDVRKSCGDAKTFSSTAQSGEAYRSCLADEAGARRALAKAWLSYSPRDRTNCIEPGPDPSYVETLTCLQMDKGYDTNLGGPIAPGLDFE